MTATNHKCKQQDQSDSTQRANSIAAPENDLAAAIGVPLSTYRAAVRGGRGPRRFKLGKRWFVRHDDWDLWLASLAETGGLTCVHSERGAKPGYSPTRKRAG